MTDMQNLKVIIIGAGMGGLTAAIALERAGFTVEIYERVRELRPAGAGISLWSNGVKVLNSLGLEAEMAAIGGSMEVMQYRDRQGELLNNIDLLPLVELVGQRPYPVARTDLQALLLKTLQTPVQLGHTCVGIDQNAQGVTATFENGVQATGDLLIAADGVRSLAREYVLGYAVEPQYGGYVNWNGLVPVSPDLAPANHWVIYVGQHQRASMMPVAGDRFYFFFDVPMVKAIAEQGGDIRADLNLFFQDWAAPVQRLIARLEPERTNRVLIHDVGPINTLVRGRVALLGDAAHATCPDLGQGGCQAMEDGWMLTHFLKTTSLGVEDALRRYNAQREPRTRAVVEKARRRAEQIHGKDPQVTADWYAQLRQESPSAVREAIAQVILAGPLH